MKEAIYSTRFLTGLFCGFVFTTIIFTFILTTLYTSNDLLKHSGFYKDGKLYKVIESSQLKGKCRGV